MYKKVIVINSDTLGRGDREIGHTLLGVLLRKILAQIDKPDAIIFYNAGVKLVMRGSYFIDILESLEKAGVELLACGTCVYGLGGRSGLLVGRISDMNEIADLLITSDQVITL